MTDTLDKLLTDWLSTGLTKDSKVGVSKDYINQAYFAIPEIIKRAVTVSDVVLDDTADWDTLTVNKLFAFNGVPKAQKLTLDSTTGYILSIKLSTVSFEYQVVFGDKGTLAYRCTSDSQWYTNVNDTKLAALQTMVEAMKQNVDSAGLAALNKRVATLEDNQTSVKDQYIELIKQIQIGGTNCWSDVKKVAGYISSAGDVIYTSAGSTRVMESYIPLNGYTNVMVRVGKVSPTGGVGSIAFYDSNKRYLSTPEHPQGSATTYFASIPVPERSAFMRLCFPWIEDKTILVQFGTLATGWIPSMDDIPFSGVSDTLAGIQKNVFDNTTAVSDLKTKVATNTTNLTANTTDITAVKNTVSLLKNQQASTVQDVDGIKQQQQTFSDDLATLKTKQQTTDANIITLKQAAFDRLIFATGDVKLAEPSLVKQEVRVVYNTTKDSITVTGALNYQGKTIASFSLKPYTSVILICDGTNYYVLQLIDNVS